MRLDFTVLWVEDQPNAVQAQTASLGRRMAKQGFELNTLMCKNISKLKAHLADDVFNDEIDLVLVDWDLGENETGQSAIEKIREVNPYKDVIFYSARTDTAALRKLAFENALEGIFFSNREDLVDEVTGVFDSLVKKALDLDNVRGIVMSATSDIDYIARECIRLAHELSDDTGRDNIRRKMVSLLEKKGPDLKRRINKLVEKPCINTILDEHFTFSANDGLRILRRILESNGFESHAHFKLHIQNYMEDVVPKRNQLGHQPLAPQGKPTSGEESQVSKVSASELLQLRCELLEMRAQFRELHKSLHCSLS